MQYFLSDSLGSVRQIIAANGGVTYTASYEPYGKLLTSGGNGSAFAFAREMTDASGLQYLCACYNSPKLKCFIQQDTWGGMRGEPTTLNPFAYAGGNPVRYTDPGGHCLPLNQ